MLLRVKIRDSASLAYDASSSLNESTAAYAPHHAAED
jgi:hypothetical protein